MTTDRQARPAHAKSREERQAELAQMQETTNQPAQAPIAPQEWQDHYQDIRPLLGDIVLPNGIVLASVSPEYIKTIPKDPSKKPFECIQLAKLGSRAYAPVESVGTYWLVEARFDLILRPVNGRASGQDIVSQKIVFGRG